MRLHKRYVLISLRQRNKWFYSRNWFASSYSFTTRWQLLLSTYYARPSCMISITSIVHLNYFISIIAQFDELIEREEVRLVRADIGISERPERPSPSTEYLGCFLYGKSKARVIVSHARRYLVGTRRKTPWSNDSLSLARFVFQNAIKSTIPRTK